MRKMSYSAAGSNLASTCRSTILVRVTKASTAIAPISATSGLLIFNPFLSRGQRPFLHLVNFSGYTVKH